MDQAIKEYVEFYNKDRLQEKFNGLFPLEYRERPQLSILFFHCLLDSAALLLF
ncbi:IS3 family transposase [Neobacillus drentensis]|uniref:IS3 family transposase n=1 Tax=Neobacillus drentensis TaxID=220684 RepID=UPI003B5862D2